MKTFIKEYQPKISLNRLKPYNTDGRITCYKCGTKLKQVVGFTESNLNYCPDCEE